MMNLLDRFVNPLLELACLIVAILLVFFVGWHHALTFTLAVLLAGAVLKIARTDRGVSTLYKAMPSHQLEYIYPGDRPSGMYDLSIRSLDGQPFTVLIGVQFDFPSLGIQFHPFSRVTSNSQGIAITRTWLGRGPVTFMYLTSIPADQIEVSYLERGQSIPPDVTSWPHLIQLFM